LRVAFRPACTMRELYPVDAPQPDALPQLSSQAELLSASLRLSTRISQNPAQLRVLAHEPAGEPLLCHHGSGNSRPTGIPTSPAHARICGRLGHRRGIRRPAMRDRRWFVEVGGWLPEAAPISNHPTSGRKRRGASDAGGCGGVAPVSSHARRSGLRRRHRLAA
jgi:hypothetical protein